MLPQERNKSHKAATTICQENTPVYNITNPDYFLNNEGRLGGPKVVPSQGAHRIPQKRLR